MPVFLCSACGTSYPEEAAPPDHCPICTDERQFVPPKGQAWITREDLGRDHSTVWRRLAPDLFSLHTAPAFAIGQRAMMLRTQAGNVLWDCIALLDAATREIVTALGGLAAIAISHPHYYTTMTDWAEAFGAPIHLHGADRRWVTRPSPQLRFWEGDSLALLPGVTLVRLGGHFAGGTVLHWAGAAGREDMLLVGDIIQISPGADHVSFQWSYPNRLPLPAASVRRIATRIAPWPFARIHGAFPGQDIGADGAGIVARAAERYCALLEADPDALEAGRA